MRTLPVAIAELVAEPEGSRRLGQFALVQQLGRGGFAPVWLAREEYAGRELRTVALKLFALESSDGERADSVDQVLEEARTLCRVEHPNIVRFHSVAIDSARRVAGFAMDHLAGTSLDHALADGPFSLPDAVDVGLSVASALAVVHRAGIVHRDVKPANIMETAAGYKLIDFGIALGARDAPRSSRPSSVNVLDPARAGDSPETLEVQIAEGTMGYIDPECIARARPATPSSDLYSLGATLFELVSGRLPAGSRGNLRGEIMDGRTPAPPLTEVVPGIDTELSSLVEQLLSPTRAGRPSSADWVVTRLEQLRLSLAGKGRALPAEDVGPFRGLSRFEAKDRGVYFGRSMEVAQALHLLRMRGVVALLGPSGSGKSSLARAGLLPAIEDGLLQTWPATWQTLSMTPGADPARTLRGLLEPLVAADAAGSPSELLTALSRRAEQTGQGVALLIDQLEELATVSSPGSRDWLAELIELSAEQAVPGFKLVVTARRDLLDPLLELSALGRVLLRNTLLIEAIGGELWADVLDQALAAYGYRCEDVELRSELVREIADTASAMPLVGFALGRLWEMRDREHKVLTRRALRSVGGIAGALAQHAQGTFERLTRQDPAAVQTARRALLALTTARGTRTSKTEQEIAASAGPDSARILRGFEAARLLVRTPTGLTLAHEVLLGNWQLLRSWVTEVQESRTLAEELEQDGERFRTDPAAVPLWPRRRLLAMSDVLSRGDVEITGAAREFLRAGQRAQRRRWVLAGGALALSLLVAAAGAWSYLRANAAERRLTERSLVAETKNRELAEARIRDVQAKQQRIDELLRDIKDSPTKDAVRELQRQILNPGAQPPPGVRAARAAAPRNDAAAPPPSSTPAAVVGAAPPSIKVQSDW
jgi:eukaryotic-like serine/threonine-protein kinase